MHLKQNLLLLLIIVPFLAKSQKNKPATPKTIAYIVQTKILKSVKDFEKNTKEIDSLKKLYASEIQESANKLDVKITLLLKPYEISNKETIEAIKLKLNQNDSAKFELYIKENELIQNASKNYDLMIKTIYEQKVQTIINKVNAAIEAYAKTNKIAVVYILENISAGLAFIDKGINITDNIITILASKN